MSESKDNTFHAGICMAGAVSAGAYTAGVMDYLLEALEHWEKAKALQQEGKLTGVPKHNFIIEVLGGASAGGMTAAITAAATQSDFAPVKQQNENDDAYKAANPLFNTWVNLKEGLGKDMMDHMLCTDDIEKDELNSHKEVRAGFNSAFIPEIAGSVLDKRISTKYKRPYLAQDADVFTTITNLRGFTYKVKFETSTGVREHRMKMHRDYAFFQLSDTEDLKNGQPALTIPDADSLTSDISKNNGRIPINFNSPNGLNTDILKQAAMSTGAFPVGLESRDLIRQRDYIEQNKYLNLMLSGQVGDIDKVKYDFLPDGDYLSLNVDGGVINNEPYEITQQLLDDRRRNTIDNEKDALAYTAKTSAKEFDSLVMMIDPFPNDDDAEPSTFISKKAWRNVVPSILSAMRGQLMMKDEQVKRAYLSDDYTRFLVMPVRTANNKAEKYTIACGSLGGFGGFFSKKFRQHDFYLGRRNCQQFLQKHFTAPADARNPILEYGYEGLSSFGYTAVNNAVYLPLVPDIRVEGDEISGYKIVKPSEEKEYAYPKIKLSYIVGLKDKIEKRIKCILDNIQNVAQNEIEDPNEWKSKIIPRIRKQSWFKRQVNNLVTSNAVNLYLSLGKSAAKGSAADACINAIITDMEKRGLIEEDV